MIDYDPHDWRSHLCDIRGSMLREILPRVILCSLWGALVVVVHHTMLAVNIPDTAHMMAGTVLGLLLVFRTNSSYDRFWEGRRLWGMIINESRNIGRLSSVALSSAPDLRDRAIRWTIAFSYAAMRQLRRKGTLGQIADELSPDEVQRVLDASHVPTATARRITEAFEEARRRGTISDFVFVTLDQNVQLLVDYVGACERIHKTPLPFAYVVHLRRALIIYCYTLPFALVGGYGWWTIGAGTLVSFMFMGIEEIGVEIEDPFGIDDNDLPLEVFCQKIHEQLADMIPSRASEKSVA